MAVPRITPADYVKARRLRLKQKGIAYPATTVAEARRAGLELAVACALLVQESGGGRNVFGHDGVDNPVVAAPGKDLYVTRERYQLYKRYRQIGRGSQGVGPTQLTYFALQDEADRLGGCWKPWINMRVGFAHLVANIRKSGLRDGVRLYNGSGPAAERYAERMMQRISDWRGMIG